MTGEPEKNSLIKRIGKHYYKLIVGNAVSDVRTQRQATNWVIREVAEVSNSPPQTAPISLNWHVVADHYGYRVPVLRKNYRHWSMQARVFGTVAIVGVLIACHRSLLGDFGGMFASLASALFCFSISIIPAWRCYQIRHHHLIPLLEFMRKPRLWWPSRLPDDYRLYADSDYPKPKK